MPQALARDVGREKEFRFSLSPGPQLPELQKIKGKYFWKFAVSEEGKRTKMYMCKATAFIVSPAEPPPPGSPRSMWRSVQ